MTDDELTRAADQLFLELDREELRTERTEEIKHWAMMIFCWDGLLPFALVIAQVTVSVVFPRNEVAIAFVGVFGPIAAFAVRFFVGYLRWQSQRTYVLQNFAFVVAICLLFLVETIWSVDRLDAKGPQIATWSSLLLMYSCYMALIAIALFPAGRRRTATPTRRMLANW